MLLEQLPEPDRARQPSRPRADDGDADLDPLVARIGRRADRVAGAERRRRSRSAWPHAAARQRERTSSVSFGTIACRSPTTPMSQKSKIGAFGSLLIATIVPEPCMPTLCWIAPEMPQAMYSFGETDLPVWPTCVEYGYQPASTTARVAPTAPPSAEASSSRSVKPSGEPSPRPPATMMSASSIDGPLDASTVVPISAARVEKSENAVSKLSTSASPPDSTGSSAPARTIPSLGPSFQPTSTITVSPSAGRVPTSSPSAIDRSVRSQLSPAPRRAASPEATSAERTEAPNRTPSAPVCATSVASASTRGCGSGVASCAASHAYTLEAP